MIRSVCITILSELHSHGTQALSLASSPTLIFLTISAYIYIQKFASSLVEHYGVAVIPGSFCGLPGWIRVCYSNLPPDDCIIAATRLKKGIFELTAAK